ncbi:hypothetical protein B381_20906 [Stutzerimonas stutzeri NF13]|uniref:Uncharacterized protein n=2 Tax=Stutzerimonas stutzeri group TaxID=136846 RepID=M2TL26_STUST|nr:hypothetical protein B381_20906 [Stutzerimonas stutzeri NF13]
MDGFASNENSIYLIAVGHADIETVDDAALLVLEKLASFDRAESKVVIGIPKIISYESTEAYSFFQEGRHLAALSKIISDQVFKLQLAQADKLIIAIDECEKCAPAIARLMRTLGTEVQLQGIKNLRFLLAGVSPFYQDMAATDRGVTRFIYKSINLEPLDKDSALALLDEKFKAVLSSAESEGEVLKINPDVIDRIAEISGGHPHLLQLLGSHVVEHEYADPDGCIDTKDLADSLRTICYESRGRDYDLLIHTMKNDSVFSDYSILVELAGGKFPSKIDQTKAHELIELSSISWLLSRNIINMCDDKNYSLVDEFLRIRVIMDVEEANVDDIEAALIESGEIPMPGQMFESFYENTGRVDDDY